MIQSSHDDDTIIYDHLIAILWSAYNQLMLIYHHHDPDTIIYYHDTIILHPAQEKKNEKCFCKNKNLKLWNIFKSKTPFGESFILEKFFRSLKEILLMLPQGQSEKIGVPIFERNLAKCYKTFLAFNLGFAR